MNKQSEAMTAQNYRPEAACCKNCKHYRSEIVQMPAAFSYSDPYTREKNKRCGIGGFPVKGAGHCTYFAWK